MGAHNALDYLSSRVFAKALSTAITMIEGSSLQGAPSIIVIAVVSAFANTRELR